MDADGQADLDCSIVVPTHRGAHRLPVLLKALTVQDYTGRWELVVVVDGQLDSTLDVLDSYRHQLPSVRVVLKTEQGGVAAAMNDGIAASQGRIVIRCDDDLTPGPTYISRHMRHHQGGSPVAVMGPTRDVFPDSAYSRAYGLRANGKALSAAYARSVTHRWMSWAANNSAPKDVLLRAGGFDTRFVYGEDFELGYRLSCMGLNLLIDPELEIDHRGPSTTVRSRAARAFVAGASRGLFEAVHPGSLPAVQEPAGLKTKAWRAVAGSIANVLRTRESFAKTGKAVDIVLGALPRPVASRVVAILVEAAGLSGWSHGTRDLGYYRGQKSLELVEEMREDDRSL